MKYIDKNTLVVKIEKCYNECLKRAKITDSYYWNAKAGTYRNVLEILNDTLETKEVDMEKEIHSWMEDNTCRGYCSASIRDTAEHFFELGIKAKKGE